MAKKKTSNDIENEITRLKAELIETKKREKKELEAKYHKAEKAYLKECCNNDLTLAINAFENAVKIAKARKAKNTETAETAETAETDEADAWGEEDYEDETQNDDNADNGNNNHYGGWTHFQR